MRDSSATLAFGRPPQVAVVSKLTSSDQLSRCPKSQCHTLSNKLSVNALPPLNSVTNKIDDIYGYTADDALRRIRLTREEAETSIRFRLCASGTLSPNIDGKHLPWRDCEGNSIMEAADEVYVNYCNENSPLMLGDAVAILVREGIINQNCEVLDLERSMCSDDGLKMLFQALMKGNGNKEKLEGCRMFRILGQNNPGFANLNPLNEALAQGSFPACDLLELSGVICSLTFLRGLVNLLENPSVLPKIRYLYLGEIQLIEKSEESLEDVLSDLDQVATKRSIRWSYIYNP